MLMCKEQSQDCIISSHPSLALLVKALALIFVAFLSPTYSLKHVLIFIMPLSLIVDWILPWWRWRIIVRRYLMLPPWGRRELFDDNESVSWEDIVSEGAATSLGKRGSDDGSDNEIDFATNEASQRVSFGCNASSWGWIGQLCCVLSTVHLEMRTLMVASAGADVRGSKSVG
jgi:hypothetical protein